MICSTIGCYNDTGSDAMSFCSQECQNKWHRLRAEAAGVSVPAMPRSWQQVRMEHLREQSE